MYEYAALAGLQLWQGIQQAETIRANAQITRQVNEMNAQYAELDAYKANQAGLSAEARYQTSIDKTLGNQKVAFAANNVDINFGSAKEVQAESRVNGFLNQLDIRNRAANVAVGYRNQAIDFRMNAQNAVRQGEVNANAAMTSSALNAGATGLSGYESYQNQKYRESKGLAPTEGN